MKIDQVINESFINEILKHINGIGIATYNIECILVEGSFLYLENAYDIDLKVIVKRYNDKAEMIRSFNISNYKVDCTYYTVRDWNKVMSFKKDAQYIVESPDMVCIYGDDKSFKRFDPVNDKEVQRFVLNVYDKNFFNYDKKNKDTFLMKDKRLWNFLLFAFKVKNKSNELTDTQLELLQKAHDLELKKDDYRPLFNEIKEIVNGSR